MFRDRELNPIIEKNNWDELTYEEQKEVLRGFTIKYSAISKGTFDPIYLTVEEKEYEVKLFNIYSDTYTTTTEDYNEVREILLKKYKESNGES